MRCLGAVAVTVVALSSCAPPPPPPPPAPASVVRRVRPPLDWFQRELVAANTARRTHVPAADKAGAQQAYNDIVRAACQRVAIEGPDKYKARCDVVLRPAAPAPANPFGCEAASDEDTLTACND